MRSLNILIFLKNESNVEKVSIYNTFSPKHFFHIRPKVLWYYYHRGSLWKKVHKTFYFFFPFCVKRTFSFSLSKPLAFNSSFFLSKISSPQNLRISIMQNAITSSLICANSSGVNNSSLKRCTSEAVKSSISFLIAISNLLWLPAVAYNALGYFVSQS